MGSLVLISCLCWNAQGRGSLEAILSLRNLLRKESLGLVFLSETRLEGARAKRVRVKVGFDGCFMVDSKGRSGGLMLLWWEDWVVNILSFSMGHIDAWVVSPDRLEWQFIGFYDNPIASD